MATTTTPKQHFDRARARDVARDTFARAVHEDTLAFRKTEWELRTDALAATHQEQRQQQQAEARAQAAAEQAMAEDKERRRWAAEQARAEADQAAQRPRRFRPADDATLEERKAALKARAYALKARNEAARQAYVQTCYDRQWRDACDDVRLLDGKALQHYMTQVQRAQLVDQSARRTQKAQDEAALDARMDRHMQTWEEAEQARQALRRQATQDTVATLEAQMAEAEAHKRQLRATQAAEDAEELAAIAADLAREDAQAEVRKRQAKAVGDAFRMSGEAHAEQQRRLAEAQRQQDLALLQHALAEGRKAEAAEHGQKEKAQAQMRLYKQYLEVLMQKDAEDEAAMDAVRHAKEEEVWQQRDAMLQARRDKSQALWRQVDQGRQEQLHLKAVAQAEEAMRQAALVEEWKAEVARGLEDDRRAQGKRQAAVRENNTVLEQQRQERRRREALEAQQEYLLFKHMQKEEADHARRKQEQAGVLRLHYPLCSGKWTA